MYDIEIRGASKNGYFTPYEARNWYGKYSRDGTAVHWWNEPHLAGTHDQTVDYLLTSAQKGVTSSNYVVSDKKITLLVNPDNVAFASGDGNASTVSIEFDPRLGDEGYKRGGWLINELEGRYGKHLPLYPHSKWVATSCPGTIDLNRLRREADNFKNGVVQEEKKEMVTRSGLSLIYRTLLGMEVSEYGLKNYLGKVSFDEAFNSVKATGAYKEKVKAAKEGKVDYKELLPRDYRNHYKPQVVNADTDKINEGIQTIKNALKGE